MSRPVQSIVTVELPLPPSVNKAFAARRGSHLLMKSAAYRFWAKQVEEDCPVGIALVPGRYGLWIDLPDGMRGDIDNRVKLLSDMLGNLHIVQDDAHMDDLHVCRRGAPKDRCIATVVTTTEWRSYCEMRLL